ncbi:hypothetical protein MAA_08598 [Metarhizium robertsii ARSEF 23]|uniref:Uncharacterized protein n=1 Tax=Metarhizium robertsii (strain ARSEF 23 / ATCC MYA-3075) TaxID=655844 RepID=E9F8J9_METRA|nr:uncharacterized protein MAA_08598 [Metarhizium robertsii ARSEF 23]EFY95945.1 hypothetical protein MAA_08598 [Metarhizium robertsii ARSEF 23]
MTPGFWICRPPRYPSNSGDIIARRLDTKAFVDAALAQRILNGSHSVPNGGWSTPIASIVRDDFVLQDELKKERQNLRDKIVNAFDVLYTERRSPRIPPTQNTTHLAGANLDPGYGTTQLKETTDPEDAASTVLVGSNRSGIIIDSDVLLRHVSGGYWVLYLSSVEVPLEMGAALAAELKFGSDANASALKIIWDQAKPGLREVKVLLNKVE